MEYLGSIWIVLVAALLFGYLASRIGLPSVVGQIIAGIVIGPALLNWVKLNEILSVSADLGIILLMFLAGLECDFKQVKKYLVSATGIAVCGVVLPLVVFFGMGMLFHQGMVESLFWGVIFAATSVSISVAVLQEYGKLQTVAGAVILGAAVVDDVISIVLLSLFTSFFTAGGNLAVIIGLQVLYLLFLVVMVKWIVPEIIKIGMHFDDEIALAIIGIVLCFSLAELAEVCHLSSVLGAFFAGIAVGFTPARSTIERSTNIIGYALLIPIFFVSVGLELKLVTSWQGWLIVILLTIVALLTKWVGCGLGARVLGFSWKDSNVIGAGMVSRGEMALIVAQVGLSSHLLSNHLYSEIIFVVILTTILSPIMLKWGLKK
ncbi:cation:proton antiporter [Fructilactobacillus myrtifloralis]|uniref:Cation:proton antiporter n=1 Tax=Fructilactobacillus myrtifloralis TaxID=2940301 RepID=A0ABY5BQ68_9LACO|nr:cation:proton antiporter [Fructilactobacillus myrtifloralis]USS85700.1 cation:proton antiporter [Fructilactobacillus myrtifloralis]